MLSDLSIRPRLLHAKITDVCVLLYLSSWLTPTHVNAHLVPGYFAHSLTPASNQSCFLLTWVMIPVMEWTWAKLTWIHSLTPSWIVCLGHQAPPKRSWFNLEIKHKRKIDFKGKWIQIMEWSHVVGWMNETFISL